MERNVLPGTWMMLLPMMVLSVSCASACADGSARPTAPEGGDARCCIQQEIDTFDALEFPPGLVSLRLYNCVIRDLKSLRALRHLRELHMRNCRLRDISPLAHLTSLSYLSLADNEITNIDPLSDCKALAWLDLRHNQIASVSALTAMDKLMYLDVRGNPLHYNPIRGDLRTIRKRRPRSELLWGPDANKVEPDLLSDWLSAKGKIANLALEAQWHYYDGFPRLPLISDETAVAFRLLHQADDLEHFVDIAIIFMKYATHILSNFHGGTLVGPKHPLVAELRGTVPRREHCGDEITTTAIADWICTNQRSIPPSVILDAQIENYHQVQARLEEEWRALRPKK